MAVAQPVFSTRLKLYDPLPSMIEGNKFLKWTDTTSSGEKNNNTAQPVGVTLKMDEKCFILYWRDLNKKSDFLDMAFVRDVKTGCYANIPKDKNSRDVLTSGKSNAPIQDKTISIYYGTDFYNIQIFNFVSMADNAVEVAKEWTDFIFKCIINQRMQNLSPWESLLKIRSVLIYGKAILDEKTREFKVPVQTIIDTFISNNKQSNESERQHILHMLQSVGLPCGKNDMLDESTLTIEKFFQFYLRLVSKEDIEQIFLKYATKRKLYLTAEQFENFLNKEQRDPGLNELLYPFYTTDKAAEMIQKFETDESFRKKKQLSPQGLIRYLMDFENELVDPIKYELHDDMEQPLSHYFINSSHNTYLTGHQITGKSDVEMYRQVLLSGCRCIELDCHDDDSQDEPIITHGRTLCTKILFSDAIHAINETAFKTSPYPVILSFENFCGKRMQEKMVKYLTEILGDQLLIHPLTDFPLKPGVQLPSPEELKYKILVKFRKKRSETPTSCTKNVEPLSGLYDSNSQVKLTSVVQNLYESEQFTASPSSGSSINAASYFHPQLSSSSLADTHTLTNSDTKSSSLSSTAFICRNNSQQTNSDSSDSEEKEDEPKAQGDSKKVENVRTSNPISINLSKPLVQSSPGSLIDKDGSALSSFKESTPIPNTLEMAGLVNYMQPITFRSFEISQKRNRSYEISSFVETNAFNLHKESPTDFVNYNKRQFSRIYPKGTRISSDNFIPQIFWNVGCQLVALNFQTLDLGMRLNQGKFEYNNKCGYILKPEIMRRTDVNKSFDPFAESPLDGIVATTLKIRIISGIFLNYSRSDNLSLNNNIEKRTGNLVTVELYGLPADSLRGQKAHRVKAASSNTFNVIYSDQGFTFRKIIMPQLALLNLSVYDDQNKMIGHRVLPVVGLRPGYRYIYLKNESNQPLSMCCLFIHLQLDDYVPEEFEEFANALVNPINYVSSQKKEEMLRTLTDENENGIDDLYDSYDPAEFNEGKLEKKLSNKSELYLNTIGRELNPALNLKRNSMVNPKTIKLFNTTLNTIKKTTSTTSSKNLVHSSQNSLALNNVAGVSQSTNNTSVDSSQNEGLNNNTNGINNSNNNIIPNFTISTTPSSDPMNPPRRDNRLFSVSIEKFGQNLLARSNMPNMLEVKRKSQSDLFNIKPMSLSSSMYNISRSCSLNCSELECMDFKKLTIINKSQLNDPNLFPDIDLESLKLNKTYVQLSKTFRKKIEKIEKEADKKIAEFAQNMSIELEKIKSESEKAKLKLEKNEAKQSKKILTIKGLKISKSTGNLDSIPKPNSSTCIDLVLKAKLYSEANIDLKPLIRSTTEKYVQFMITTLQESYTTIKNIKLASIQPLCARLEKLINEAMEFRMQQLKAISDKETLNVNKQAHQLIKLKKKRAQATSQDKDEFQRLSREIEKESVTYAACENAKIEELLKAKQKLLKQVIDKSLNNLSEYKTNLIKTYENEYFQSYNQKKLQLEQTYLNKDNLENNNDDTSRQITPNENDIPNGESKQLFINTESNFKLNIENSMNNITNIETTNL